MHKIKFFSKSAVDFWLNMLICALLISLLVQCSLFLADFVEQGKADGEIPFEMQMLSTSTQNSRLNIDDAMFHPALIAIRADGTTSAVVNSTAVVNEVYADVNSCLFRALQNEPVRISDRKWADAAQMDDYVYVRYFGEFPHQVVFAFAAAQVESEMQIRQAETYVGIREALLVPDDSGKIAYLYVRGGNGAYVFAADRSSDINMFSDYAVTYPDVFYAAEMRINGNDTEFFVTEKISARDIYVSEIGVSALLSNRTHLDSLLRLLNYNPDKLRYHTESDGTVVYVESHGVLRMDSKSVNYSAAEQGGISLSRIVGKEASGDIYSYLRAASYIVWRMADMDPLYTGGDAELVLRSVSSDDGAITLQFSFTSDNMEIYKKGGDAGLTITFRGDKITQIVHHMTIVRRGSDERKLMLQAWYKEQLAPGLHTAMRPVYRMEEGTISISAEWIAELLPQKEGGGR